MTSAQDATVPVPAFAAQPVVVSRSGDVATVTLNNPLRKNSMSDEGWRLLREALDDVARSTARVLVVTGTGADFCAGADLSGGPSDHHPLLNMRFINEACIALHRLAIPVIARVDGNAVGAGMNLALACDFVIATDRARFSEIFVKRGLSIDFGGSWLLPRLVGLHRAKAMVLLGDFVSSQEALTLGIVREVVAPDDLDDAVTLLADRLLAGPPIAMSQSKRMLNDAFESTLDQALENEARAQTINGGMADAVEAANAFFEKRPPVFRGH
jgi:enoyl-CoA hydratase/carnithine racemase